MAMPFPCSYQREYQYNRRGVISLEHSRQCTEMRILIILTHPAKPDCLYILQTMCGLRSLLESKYTPRPRPWHILSCLRWQHAPNCGKELHQCICVWETRVLKMKLQWSPEDFTMLVSLSFSTDTKACFTVLP